MAMEMERQLEVAARIRELRGQMPQPKMADRVGVTLRAYQRWEAGDGIRWDNLERLAEIHGVTTNWLLYGDERPEGARSQLDRIEQKIDELLALRLEQELLDAERATQRSAGTARTRSGSRKTG
jgi:transcriptional regulator with XRE-family HTH domain